MDGEANGTGGDGEIDSLYERRTLTNFISMWKPFLDILQQNEKNENWFGNLMIKIILDYGNNVDKY